MTENQDPQEAAEERLVNDYLSKATPPERHLFVVRSNYDSNSSALDLLIDDPATGKATALALYWNLGAAWHAHYADLSEVPSHEQRDFLRTRLLEERYLADFYQDTEIWFDPMSSEGGRPGEYPERTIAHPAPTAMITAVGTEFVDLEPEGYDDGLPFALLEEISALYED